MQITTSSLVWVWSAAVLLFGMLLQYSWGMASSRPVSSDSQDRGLTGQYEGRESVQLSSVEFYPVQSNSDQSSPVAMQDGVG